MPKEGKSKPSVHLKSCRVTVCQKHLLMAFEDGASVGAAQILVEGQRSLEDTM